MSRTILLIACFLFINQQKAQFLHTFSLSHDRDLVEHSQNGDSLDSKKKKFIVASAAIGLTGGSLIYLNQAWYQQYASSSFHFFNDLDEWMQMDKVGHAYTNYQTARLMIEALDWCGMTRKKQLLVGGTIGLGYTTVIEIMDGFSTGWGFSWGDMTANGLGSLLAIGQKRLWNEQRISLKFSYRFSTYAQYRPDQLGNSLSEKILKDYNAQTYWLSVNLASILNTQAQLPKWLNLAFGYGADGMIGARTNMNVLDSDGHAKTFKRYRQYYLSLDVDLSRIKTRSKILKAIFNCVNTLKIPFPTLEVSQSKLKTNWF